MTRRNPNLNSLQREIDRVFDSFFSSRDTDGSSSSSTVWAPRTDIAEHDDGYALRMDLPGVAKEDVTINYDDGRLTVSGERTNGITDGANRVRSERTFGSFYRSFTLPRSVDASSIEATFENGVLNISVPKAETSKPRQIEIN
jgi:HSP20 family protein